MKIRIVSFMKVQKLPIQQLHLMKRSEFLIEMRRKEAFMTEIKPVKKNFPMREDPGHE